MNSNDVIDVLGCVQIAFELLGSAMNYLNKAWNYINIPVHVQIAATCTSAEALTANTMIWYLSKDGTTDDNKLHVPVSWCSSRSCLQSRAAWSAACACRAWAADATAHRTTSWSSSHSGSRPQPPSPPHDSRRTDRLSQVLQRKTSACYLYIYFLVRNVIRGVIKNNWRIDRFSSARATIQIQPQPIPKCIMTWKISVSYSTRELSYDVISKIGLKQYLPW